MRGTCAFCKKEFKKRHSIQAFCSIICSNRAHLNNRNKIGLPTSHSVDLAELFGILLGDGSVATYYAKVYLNVYSEGGYAVFIQRLFQKLFPGSTVTRIKREARGTWEVQLSSKEACDYLKKIGFDPKIRDIPSWIWNNQGLITATIRGLFDTEGTVGIKYVKGKKENVFYRQLTVTNSNKNILYFLEKALTQKGFRPTKNSRKNIYISNRLDIQRYLDDIGSHNPKLLKKLGRQNIGIYTRRGA